MLKIEMYQRADHAWHWRARGEQGTVIAESGEGFADRAACLRAADRLRLFIGSAVHDWTVAPVVTEPPSAYSVAPASTADEHELR
jgi:uncharacterized protein YegP (UPF0339 family)